MRRLLLVLSMFLFCAGYAFSQEKPRVFLVDPGAEYQIYESPVDILMAESLIGSSKVTIKGRSVWIRAYSAGEDTIRIILATMERIEIPLTLEANPLIGNEQGDNVLVGNIGYQYSRDNLGRSRDSALIGVNGRFEIMKDTSIQSSANFSKPDKGDWESRTGEVLIEGDGWRGFYGRRQPFTSLGVRLGELAGETIGFEKSFNRDNFSFSRAKLGGELGDSFRLIGGFQAGDNLSFGLGGLKNDINNILSTGMFWNNRDGLNTNTSITSRGSQFSLFQQGNIFIDDQDSFLRNISGSWNYSPDGPITEASTGSNQAQNSGNTSINFGDLKQNLSFSLTRDFIFNFSSQSVSYNKRIFKKGTFTGHSLLSSVSSARSEDRFNRSYSIGHNLASTRELNISSSLTLSQGELGDSFGLLESLAYNDRTNFWGLTGNFSGVNTSEITDQYSFNATYRRLLGNGGFLGVTSVLRPEIFQTGINYRKNPFQVNIDRRSSSKTGVVSYSASFNLIISGKTPQYFIGKILDQMNSSEFVFYYDDNGNGEKDPDEEFAEGIALDLIMSGSEEPFDSGVTDEEGSINFGGIPRNQWTNFRVSKIPRRLYCFR